MLKKYFIGLAVIVMGAFLVGCQATSQGMVATTTCCKYYTTQQSTNVKSCSSCSQYTNYHATAACGNRTACYRPVTSTCGGTSCNTQYSCPNDHGDYSTDNIGYYDSNQDCYYDQCNRYRCYN